MKKIELRTYSKTIDENYLVKLGNGFEFEFKQEKQAISFLRKTSKFLTEQLAFINHVYTNVFVTYRQNYLLFSPSANSKQAPIFKAERNLNELFIGVSDSLNKSVWMSPSQNGNYIVFSAFYYCINSLRNACYELNVLVERKNLTALKYELTNYQNEINLIERGLNEFEQLKAIRSTDRARFMDITNISMSKVV
nr:hypothetical protein [uncultured Carboxylicivirga sp.]